MVTPPHTPCIHHTAGNSNLREYTTVGIKKCQRTTTRAICMRILFVLGGFCLDVDVFFLLLVLEDVREFLG